MNSSILSKRINGKNILVTGGGGSMVQVCLEILKYKPKKIYALDSSEINLFKLVDKIKKLKKK